MPQPSTISESCLNQPGMILRGLLSEGRHEGRTTKRKRPDVRVR